MINPRITKLIEEMQEVKAAHSALEIADVLRIFNIDATLQLAGQTQRMANR